MNPEGGADRVIGGGDSSEAPEDRWLLVLDDPIMGLLPWVAWGLLPYVWSALASALVALVLAAGIVALAWWRGERPKLLEWSDAALFAGLVVVALVATPGVNEWFEDHADLLSNGGLALLAVGSLVLRRPFTAPYTEARFPGLDEALAARLDTFSTAAWAVGLTVATIVTWYGEFVLRNPNDLWTGWVFQLVPLALAYNTTLWFDRRAVRRAAHEMGPAPSVWALVGSLALIAAPVGVLALVFKEAPALLADGLVVGGVSLALVAFQFSRRQATVRALPFVLDEGEDDDWG